MISYMELARMAVLVADKFGKENREQAAIAWLHECGHYEVLNGDEKRDLDRYVREACEDIAPE